jgi:hypothetical protein
MFLVFFEFLFFSVPLFVIGKDTDSVSCMEIIQKKHKLFENRSCQNKWSDLKSLIKPTQSEVGYAWVQRKLNDYSKESKAKKTMEENSIPVVIGPNHFFYVVDQHHELSAFDYSGFSDVTVTLNVICDHRLLPTMDAFWNYMNNSHLVYLGAHPNGDVNALPIQITPNQLPQYFSFTENNKSLGNDPWRSLASFARKVNSHYLDDSVCNSTETNLCYRAYYRGCVDGTQSSGAGVAFYEFRWGYFFLDGSFHHTEYWQNASNLATFLTTFQSQESLPMNRSNLLQWNFIASLIIPLARSASAANFQTPSVLFHSIDATGLPGYVAGDEKILNDDPDCNAPSCPTFSIATDEL